MSPPSSNQQRSVPAEDSEGHSMEVLEPDEMPTPGWLPLVGLGLLLVVLSVFLATRPSANKEGLAPERLAPVGVAPVGVAPVGVAPVGVAAQEARAEPKADRPTPAGERPVADIAPGARAPEPTRRPAQGCGP